jgi:hypothetical protein
LFPLFDAVAVNVVLVEPCGIITVEGRTMNPGEAERVTGKLPVAAFFNVTVPVVESPPVSVVDEKLSEVTVSATAVKTAFAEECGIAAYRLSE